MLLLISCTFVSIWMQKTDIRQNEVTFPAHLSPHITPVMNINEQNKQNVKEKAVMTVFGNWRTHSLSTPKARTTAQKIHPTSTNFPQLAGNSLRYRKNNPTGSRPVLGSVLREESI